MYKKEEISKKINEIFESEEYVLIVKQTTVITYVYEGKSRKKLKETKTEEHYALKPMVEIVLHKILEKS